MRAWLPDTRGHRRLFSALSIDALGTGLFLPFSVLYFTATTDLSLAAVGLALSVAALVRIPATPGAGMLCDRFGARNTVILSNLVQAAGFANYLLVGSFAHLLVAAIVVQVGNSAFWVAYPTLVHDVARGERQESWFALITALRHAGLGVGALGASLAVAVGGVHGYTAIVAVNALSFTVAATLTWFDNPAAGRRRVAAARSAGAPSAGEPPAGPPPVGPPPVTEPPLGQPGAGKPTAGQPGASGWGAALSDRPFLGFVVLNLGLALLSLAFALAVPVFLVDTVHLPPWIPGTVLAVNAGLGALGATPVGAAITGRRRSGSLLLSQAAVGVGFLTVLCCAYVPRAAGVGLAFGAVVLVTFGELIQNLVVGPVVNDTATAASRGRYNSLSQMAFSIGDVVTPALMTALLARGPVATWAPLAALAALRRRINDPAPAGWAVSGT
ncbi:MFS transporter [Streptomyces sp. NPDC050560]|uniref:MFS transporter n=1 Tax=Streptomyces sp. NPDC050560 TaxID=3365630 RepID=UPI00379A8A20